MSDLYADFTKISNRSQGKRGQVMAEKFVLDAENENPISKAAEDFMKNVIAAYEKMLEAEIEANVIVLNGNKFSFLKKPGLVPTLFGMKVEYANLPESWDFYLQYRAECKTNAERIRSMTDEELATFLYNFGDCPCFGVKFCERGTRCEDAVLMKLREPFDNGACSADETSEKVKEEE